MDNNSDDLLDQFQDWAERDQEFRQQLLAKFDELSALVEKTAAERDHYEKLYERATSATFEDLIGENNQLQGQLVAEKERRTHWQGLAYAGMTLVDRLNGDHTRTHGGVTEETFGEVAGRIGRRLQRDRLRSSHACLQIEALDFLREGEGDSVTIYCDNPEFDGPAAKVVCNGAWTGWVDREFTGKTSAEAIWAAETAKTNLSPDNYPLTPSPPVSTEIQPFRYADHVFDVRKILWGVIANAALCAAGRPLWAVVRDRTGLGSTSSSKLCLALGFDPDTGQELTKPDSNEVSNDQTQQDDDAAS